MRHASLRSRSQYTSEQFQRLMADNGVICRSGYEGIHATSPQNGVGASSR
jgi:hypothetical protein